MRSRELSLILYVDSMDGSEGPRAGPLKFDASRDLYRCSS